MAKGSKKGRLTGGQRKELNQKVVNSVMDGDVEDAVFARVIKHLGAGNIRVILPNKREAIAKIRNVLARRGSTPIVSGDIVILSGRDFETKAGDEMRYDVLGVMNRHESAKMEKAGHIPSWMLVSAEATEETEGDIFDFSESKETETEDVDIDAI
jgi:translation initiation factor IF-1